MAKTQEDIERTREIVGRLEALAKEHDIAPTTLAVSLGMAKSSFSDWRKKASPSLDALLKFSNYFHVSLDYLVTGSDSPYAAPKMEPWQSGRGLSPTAKALVSKYESLPPELKGRADAYMDVLTSMVPSSQEERMSG